MVRLVSHLHIQKGYKQPDKFIQKSEEEKKFGGAAIIDSACNKSASGNIKTSNK